MLGEHGVEVDLAPDLPLAMVDAVLFEQVLFNLLDNAAKYSPASTKIRVLGWQEGSDVRLQIIDEAKAFA